MLIFDSDAGVSPPTSFQPRVSGTSTMTSHLKAEEELTLHTQQAQPDR